METHESNEPDHRNWKKAFIFERSKKERGTVELSSGSSCCPPKNPQSWQNTHRQTQGQRSRTLRGAQYHNHRIFIFYFYDNTKRKSKLWGTDKGFQQLQTTVGREMNECASNFFLHTNSEPKHQRQEWS